VSDAPQHDDWWLGRLYAAAEREMAWAVGDVERLYGGLAQEAGLDQIDAARLLTRIDWVREGGISLRIPHSLPPNRTGHFCVIRLSIPIYLIRRSGRRPA
jgi:hypothetical protein